MNPADKQEIAAALDEVHELIAGDEVIAVSPEGDEYPLTVLMEDYDSEGAEGLAIDHAGLKDQRTREVTILKSDLTAAGITLTVEWHFLIDGERWDFAKGEMLSDHTVPLAGIHNQVMCILRRAVEVNKSTSGSEFTYGD